MADKSLRDGVLAVLAAATVPLYAREIAGELASKGVPADRTSVNQILYGELSDRVTKSSDYRWRLITDQSTKAPTAPDPKARAAAAAKKRTKPVPVPKALDPKARAAAAAKKRTKPVPVPKAPDPETPPASDEQGAADPVPPDADEPSCPDCGGPMIKRIARHGRDAGKQFWGCRNYPECRGTVSIRTAGEEQPEIAVQVAPGAAARVVASGRGGDHRLPRPIAWWDPTVDRPGWICRHATAGASLRSVAGSSAALRPLATCWIARPDTGLRESNDALRRFSGSINKILQRGICPPLDPVAETLLLRDSRVALELAEPIAGDLAPRLSDPPVLPRDGLRNLWASEPLVIDPTLVFDSEEERLFLTEWAPDYLDPVTIRSIIPQAPLDSLARAAGIDRQGMRRVDFLIQSPDGSRFVVEIDGEQHSEATDVDADRDELLHQLQLDVIRVPASEVRALEGPQLDEVWSRVGLDIQPPAAPSARDALLTQVPVLVHRTVLALVEALTAGLLGGDQWVVEIDDPWGVVADLLPPYLDLMAAADILASAHVMPSRIELHSAGETFAFARDGSRYGRTAGVEQDRTPDVLILLEPGLSPLDDLGAPGDTPTIVVRSAFIPVRIADPFLESTGRVTVSAEPVDCANALEVLLQGVFAKESFRDGQLAALQRVIEGDSCAVLLPTGAGKSLIYQLAGLVLPGRTLIIDPIVALMEDQVRGLRANGIDRVVDVSRASVTDEGTRAILETVASGDALFIFMTPERLQQAGFREALRSLAQRTTVNIAVVDEAHCVSEWGHDFRTAYLNLGRILRDNLSSNAKDPGPPILALTGTASRAVLHDMLRELKIESPDGDAVIQPSSFDRPELRYRIQVERSSNAVAALTGAVSALPGDFGVPPSTFFHPRGHATLSGLVFCPHVNGRYGVVKVAEELGRTLQIDVPFYSGSAPRGWPAREWETVKRHNADEFMDNRAPILVSTKAFGMGIDKPNVRYVVHLGIPQSIEAYYQEVGRAGRDRQRSECILVTTEYDDDRARRLLDDEADLEAVRAEVDGVRLSGSDDITRMLFFQLRSFIGEDAELTVIKDLLRNFEKSLGKAGTVFVAMEGEDKEQERGLHRLVVLGVLRDYLVDWGGKKYQAELANCTARTVFESLIAYVRRSQPGQADQIEAELASIEGLPLPTAIVQASARLVRFVYDTVERSRRRSLREMWLAAREGRDDPNGTFRQRILDYLTQGSVAPTLEMLVDQELVAFPPWIELLDGVWRSTTAGDHEAARELRGGTGRLLASYPDHPGLLVARGVSEALIPDGELEELVSNLRAARSSGASRYGITAEEFAHLEQWLVRRAREWKRHGALTGVVLGLASDDGIPLHYVTREDLENEAGLAVLSLSHELNLAAGAVAEIASTLTN